MKKTFALPFVAVVAMLAFTVMLSAFTGQPSGVSTSAALKTIPNYFHFTGTPGQEDDETRWEQITQEQYEETYSDCNKVQDGCRLITSNTQIIAGVVRPQLVEVIIVGLHKNPKTSTLSGVTAVGNKNAQ